jgi:hypothetical protein
MEVQHSSERRGASPRVEVAAVESADAPNGAPARSSGRERTVAVVVRFGAKGAVFLLGLAALLAAIDHLSTSGTQWDRYEDPRARMLWDGNFDGSRIVLLGDSVFASLYVNTLDDALWARLETYTDQRVFPGALNAARPRDVLAATVQVSREWPPGTTVFISVPPTRFLVSRAPEAAGGNFADAFFRRYGIVDARHASLARRMQGFAHGLLAPFLAVRARSAVANLVDRPARPRWMRQRTWSDPGESARELFEFFEANLVLGAPSRPFTWLDETRHELEAAGMHPVFVLTPLNEALVRAFATKYPADVVLQHVRSTVSVVEAHLRASRAEVIDLTDAVPSGCFFDLLHLNTCGEDVVARRLAAWVQQDLNARSGE